MLPKLSVCMVTYNHEKFISEAIESVLMQKTNFAFELVIGEDHSIDKTKEIVIMYQNKYPNTIRVITNNKNMGPALNFFQTYNSCDGKYIAFLEGDDYWTNSRKLQQQVDLLVANPELSLCFHATEAFSENDLNKTYIIPSHKKKKKLYVLKDLLQQNFIATCSVMYRNRLVKKIPSWLPSLKIGDWPLHILYATRGKIGYIDQVMARYRIHDDSVLSSRSRVEKFIDIIKIYRMIDRHLHYAYRGIINQMIGQQYYLVAQEYLRGKDKTRARNTLKKAFSTLGLFQSLRNRQLYLFLKMYCSSSY